MVPVTGIVAVGPEALEHLEGCPRPGRPMEHACAHGIPSLCAPTSDRSCGRAPLVVSQLTPDRGGNGSHSIMYKVACYLLLLFLLHSFYLYLNVSGNQRQPSVQVKVRENEVLGIHYFMYIKHSCKTDKNPGI